MKRFTFRLEKLLRLCLSREKAAEAELAEARRREEEEHRRLTLIEVHLVQTMTRTRELERHPANVTEIKKHRDYLKKLGADREQGQAAVAAAAAVAAEKMRALLEIRTERKSLENLKAKRQADHTRQALAEEQKVLDEVGGREAARKRTPA